MAKNLNSKSIHSGTREFTGKLHSLKGKFMNLAWDFFKNWGRHFKHLLKNFPGKNEVSHLVKHKTLGDQQTWINFLRKIQDRSFQCLELHPCVFSCALPSICDSHAPSNTCSFFKSRSLSLTSCPPCKVGVSATYFAIIRLYHNVMNYVLPMYYCTSRVCTIQSSSSSWENICFIYD